MRTDGVPCFASTEFRDFCNDHSIAQEISSAHNPASNGLAEAHVKVCKHLFLKCVFTGENFEKALCEMRLSPRSNGYSPADLFYKRCPRGYLPGLKPGFKQPEAVQARQDSFSAAAEKHEDQKELPNVEVGDPVMIQDARSRFWNRQGVVVQVRENGRSYVVISDSWRLLRNRRLLRLNRTRPDAWQAENRIKKPGPPALRCTQRLESKPKLSYAEALKSDQATAAAAAIADFEIGIWDPHSQQPRRPTTPCINSRYMGGPPGCSSASSQPSAQPPY